MIDPKSIYGGRERTGQAGRYSSRAALVALAAFEDGIELDGALEYFSRLDRRPVEIDRDGGRG